MRYANCHFATTSALLIRQVAHFSSDSTTYDLRHTAYGLRHTAYDSTRQVCRRFVSDLQGRLRQEVLGRDGEALRGRGSAARQRTRRSRVPRPRREEAEGGERAVGSLPRSVVQVATYLHRRKTGDV